MRDFVYDLSTSHHGLSQTVHGLAQAVHGLTLNMEEMNRVSSGCTIPKRCIKRILRKLLAFAGRFIGFDAKKGGTSAAVEREEPVQEREESLQKEERVEILPSQELRRVPGGLCISSKEETR